MTYPEKGATYKHKPKFIDRAMKEEGVSPKPWTQDAGKGDEVTPAIVSKVGKD